MLDQARIKSIQEALNRTLKEFADENGINVGSSRIAYNSTTFKVTVEFADKDGADGFPPEYVAGLVKFGFRYGLAKKDLGQPFKTPAGDTRIFVGVRGKFAIGKAADGKLYKYDAAYVGAKMAG